MAKRPDFAVLSPRKTPAAAGTTVRDSAASLSGGPAAEPAGETAASPSNASNASNASDALIRLTRLIAALDGAAARLQEAQRAETIPQLVGAALRELGIESQVSLLDIPIEPPTDSSDPSLAGATLRIAYASVAPSLLRAAERLIGRPVIGMPIPLERVSVFAQVVRTRQPCYWDKPSEGMREIFPWIPDTAKRQLARLAHATTSITAPLLSRGRVLGVMSVWGDDLRREDILALAAFARQAGVAIDNARLFEETQQRADELEAVFASMAAGVAIYDLHGKLLRVNEAAQQITRRDKMPEMPPDARRDRLALRHMDGSPVASHEMPSARAARGETLNIADYFVDGEDGPDTVVSVVGAPLRGMDGAVRGSVVVFRNVTQFRRLTRRTYEALQALLEMAGILAAPPPRLIAPPDRAAAGGARDPSTAQASLHAALRHLCQLTTGVLGCDRVAIELVDPQTLLLTPIAVAGLTPEQDAAWLAEQQAQWERGTPRRLGEANPDAARRLERGEPVIVDMTQPPYVGRPNPYDARTVLVVPMVVERRIAGMLALDYRDGSPDEPAHVYAPDEIALAEGVARLAALAVERHRLEQVAAEVETLRAADALKEEFLSIASHELKTPLTVLQARTQSTRRRLERMGLTEAAAQFAPVQAALDRMRALVQELLDASRIQAGRLELQLEPCDLGKLVAAAVAEVREVEAHTIVVEGADGPGLWTQGDPERLAQVLTNLLENATKYSPLEAPIAVRVRRESASTPDRSQALDDCDAPAARSQIVITIMDQGIGIPADEVTHVFDRFYRARTASSRQYGGLGLGLHIAATIVERHGGCIWAESPGPGHGSTFGMALLALEPPQTASS
jgi:signal transduction histidine kinase/PAS domain-containing protein